MEFHSRAFHSVFDPMETPMWIISKTTRIYLKTKHFKVQVQPSFSFQKKKKGVRTLFAPWSRLKNH